MPDEKDIAKALKEAMKAVEAHKPELEDAQSKLRVRSAVEDVLHAHLPDTYHPSVFRDKINRVFDMMVDYAHQVSSGLLEHAGAKSEVARQ